MDFQKSSRLPIDQMIERYCDFFINDYGSRQAFCRMALSSGEMLMAAVAAAAEVQLQPGAESDAYATKVVDSAMEQANLAISNGETGRELQLLHACFLAMRRQPAGLAKVCARIEERLIEEIDRDPIEADVIEGLIGIGAIAPATLLEVFEKADNLGAHAIAGRAAEAVIATNDGRLDKHLLRALRGRTRDFLSEKNALAAGIYFVPLYRMAATIESVAILLPRVARLLAESLKAGGHQADQAEKIAAGLTKLDPQNPVLLRYHALKSAQNGDTTTAKQHLDALEPSEWRNVLICARAARELDDRRSALVLYTWLIEHGFALSEGTKFRDRMLRERVLALRESMRSGNASAAVDSAAAVLEMQPEHERALWIKARALLKLRDTQEGVATLRKLVAISQTYPGAVELLARFEQRSAALRA